MDKFTIAFKSYLEKEKKYSAHTILAYSNDLETFQKHNQLHFDQNEIHQVNYAQIRSWIVSLVESGLTTITVNRKIASLKAFYKFLLKIKAITENPLSKHHPLKSNKKTQIPFSENEVQLALAQIENPVEFNSIRDKLIVELLYTSGIRRAELIDLKFDQVDVDNQTIKVLGKRNKERIMPILPIVANQMQLYIKERNALDCIEYPEYFFLSKKGLKLNETFVYRLINSYFSDVSEKVKKSPHVLRHSFATHLLNNGADLNSVKELLGHSSLASTQVYTNSSLDELKRTYFKSHPRNK